MSSVRYPTAASVPAHLGGTTQHDLCTPLTVVHGHAQLLRRRLDRLAGLTERDRTHLQRSAAAIERASRDLAAVINRLEPRGGDRRVVSGRGPGAVGEPAPAVLSRRLFVADRDDGVA